MRYFSSVSYGKFGSDVMTGRGFNASLGLKGDDTLYSGYSTFADTFLLGGSGNDTYILNQDSSTIIYDTAGYDTLVIDNMNLFNWNNVIAKVDNKHLIIADSPSINSVIIIVDFFIDNGIEVFQYGNRTESYETFSKKLEPYYAIYGNINSDEAGLFSLDDDLKILHDMETTREDRPDAMEVARLYQAGLGRVPDEGGMNYWIDVVDGGVALYDVSETFLDSPEFTARFGDIDTLSNEDYINLLYNNVLGREAEQGGFEYWVNVMNQNLVDDAQVLMFFAASDENKERTEYLNTMSYTDGDWSFIA